MNQKIKIALCQMDVGFSKEDNLTKAKNMVAEAAANGGKIVALPEMWNCPYSNDYFAEYSEPENGPTEAVLSALAKEHGIYLIGGSIPEQEEGKIYNTSYSFDPNGTKIAKHRKVHLFDIDVKGKIRFMESDTLTSGDQVTVFDTMYGKIGVAICYDMRFPEMIRVMALEGAKMVFLPGAFNMTTGPAHWTLTMRARALDNQIYFAAISPARNESAPYTAYGHSGISNPWGEIIQQTDETESIVYGEVDLAYEESIRDQLPLLKHMRKDVYDIRKL